MKRVINKLENSKVEVVCDIDEKVWKEAQEKAFEKLAKDLSLPGFRKGHVPTEMARKHIESAKILNEAINNLLQPSFDEVLKEEKLTPIVRPTVDVTKVSDKELQLKFVIVLPPEVTLGNYKGLDIAKDKVSVSKEEVEKEVEKLVSQNANLVVSENPAKVGDTVVIDFVGSIDGKEFDGGKADNFSLELGSHQFVPGFEEQLVGVKSGDVVDVLVTFPTQYVKELAGKKANFKVTVHEVKEKVVPELNEELIKELAIPEVNDVSSLHEHIKKQLTSQKESQATNKLLDAIIAKVVETSKVDLSKEIVDEEVEGMKHNVEEQMKSRGLTMEQYLEITGQDKEKFEENLRKDAEKNLRSVLVMEEIAKAENIKVEEKDLEDEYKKIADQYKMDVKQVKEILSKDLNRLSMEIRTRRIQDFLIEANEKKNVK